ncbi:hypothetical protein SCWH03_55820 [Streptomyces pacificus]|uniref:Uncharacterized protein n=1 Tax=Streptomyces pacificus TaxID=2705029 RepID=A0A6A0B6H1_9ACTN|nr:hypothetical protein SCWH03_55820 [Streptomyces pacificus]
MITGSGPGPEGAPPGVTTGSGGRGGAGRGEIAGGGGGRGRGHGNNALTYPEGVLLASGSRFPFVFVLGLCALEESA